MTNIKELTLEQLDKVNGGTVTPQMEDAYYRLNKIAEPNVRKWNTEHPDCTPEESVQTIFYYLKLAYQEMSDADKLLVDAYIFETTGKDNPLKY